MMEAFGNDQYITFPIVELQDTQENSSMNHQEEISKSVTEYIVPEINIETITNEISDCRTIQLSDDSQNANNAVFLKQKSNHMTSVDDESMAVEALRQLGGMYPQISEKKINCSLCNTLVLASELENHQKNCKSDNFICSVCGEKFGKKVDYTNHIVCHQVDRPHACRVCGNLFRSKSNLLAHMTEMHRTKLYKCNICGVDFQRPSSLSNHMKIHTYVAGRALIQSNSEQKSTISNSQASTSITSLQDYDSVQWSMPVYSFSNDQSTPSLDDSDEKINSLQEFTVIPNGEITQFAYANQNVIPDTHFVDITTIANSASEKNEGPKKPVSPKECEFCDKQFQDSNHLATHQETGLKRIGQVKGSEQGANWGKHACSECGKKFMTKQKMFRHQWIHRKKTHCCEVCGMQFEHQGELDEHRLSAHPGDSPFTCSECGKCFVSRQGLWEHGRTHAGSPAHFHCDKCSKTFTSKQGYLIHHRTHTGERPYGCKFCWKAFRDGGTLRKHERIHTGERPHVCPLCSRAFNQKVVLREHVRWVHAAAKHKTDSPDPPYLCPICGDPSQDRDELCAHIVKHSDKMIAEAKAKNNSETKKTTKASKRKTKEFPKASLVKEEENSLNMDQEQILITVAESLNKTGVNQNIFVDSKQNTYILVNTGKNNKLHIVSDVKQTTEVGRIKGGAIQICIEDPNLDPDVKEEDNFQKGNILRLLSKNNIGASVLTIGSSQTNDNLSSQIQLAREDVGNELTEQDETELENVDAVVDSVSYENVDNDANEIIEECRVCGEIGFKDKRELMEHVKIHM